jgi:uncharacterized integral membrane protein (TIGR00698 family)
MTNPKSLAPGLLLCSLLSIVAALLQVLEARFAGQAYLEELVIAIVVGLALRAVWSPGAVWQPGIAFSAKILLEVAVVLLGAAVSAHTVLALGPWLLAGIALVVAVSILASYFICRVLALPSRMALLVACGNSICGNSAIAAVAPVIGAQAQDITAAIAFTALLGVLVVLLLPLLVPLLALSLTQYGVLAGLTVYAVPQVLAATLPIGALSNQVGTVVKLVRVLMLGPVILTLSLFFRGRGRPAWHELLPWFILGFLALLLLRSLGVIPPAMLGPLKALAAILTTISMAALGLGVELGAVARAGLRVCVAVTLSLLVLCGISLALIRVLHIA